MARNLIEEQIPESWTYDLLDNLAERASGHTPSKSYPEYWNGGIKWISLADTFRLDNGYVYETDKEISQEGINNSSAQLHPAETVVLSRDAGIGKSGVMAEPMAVSQHFIAWKCDNEKKMNSWFLYNWLQLHKSEFERQAVGSTIKTIGLPFFKKLKIAAPPYKEQQKIAQILSTWDKAITATERLIDKSKQQKKALMQQLLTGKNRLLDDSGQPFDGKWEEVKLGDVVSTGRGFAFKSTQYSESGYKIVRVTNIDSSGNIDLSDCVYIPDETACEYKKYELLENDVLLVMVGATAGKLGFVTKKTLPALLNQNMWSLRTKDRVQLCQLFLRHVIYGVVAKYLLSQQGSARGFFTQKTFELVKFSIPSIQEQQKIASVLTNADEEIELLNKQLADLKQEKKALMQQLLTGKRRVKLDTPEVA